VTIQQNTDRIYTTHIGSLPRPHRLLDRLKAKFSGGESNQDAFNAALHQAVVDVVREQVELRD
jgi:5-methyltetrahydropteroyltriglutamate--homocysteine methyltransferase